MRPLSTLRGLLLGGLPILVAAGVWFLYCTPTGGQIRQEDLLRQWIAARPATGPLLFVLIYCLAGLLALPVWWLQIIAGHCFGLAMGMLWCHLGAIFSAAIAVRLGQWLLGQWLQRRIGPYQQRFDAIDRKLGHNGLLVVTAARVSHIMPFGLTNYLFGLSRISLLDVIAGTLLGGTLSKMIHVAAGTNPRLLANPRFLALLVGINLVLLSPLLVRYLRPSWFQRVGVE